MTDHHLAAAEAGQEFLPRSARNQSDQGAVRDQAFVEVAPVIQEIDLAIATAEQVLGEGAQVAFKILVPIHDESPGARAAADEKTQQGHRPTEERAQSLHPLRLTMTSINSVVEMEGVRGR